MKPPFVVALTVVVAACADPSESGQGVPAFTSHEDQTVTVVRNGAPHWERKPWTVDETPDLTIADDGPDGQVQLFGVVGVWRFGGGGIVVADGRARQGVLFDADGQFVRRFGGPGEGPGEFPSLNEMFRCDEETLVLEGSGRVSFFDQEGNFLGSEQHAPRLQPTPAPVSGISSDCSALLLRDIHTERRSPTEFELRYALRWAPLDGSPPESVASFSGQEILRMTEPYVADITPPFAPVPVWTVARDEVFLGLGDDFEIRVYAKGRGLHRIVRWEGERRPIERPDRERYALHRAAALEIEPGAQHLRPLSEFSLPDHKPVYSRLIVDAEGNLWVREYPFSAGGAPELADLLERIQPVADPEPEEWLVFDPDGALLGPVTMPPGLRVLRIEGGQVIGVALDDFGVQRVQFHRVAR